jgi:hypothetical protein
MRFVRSRAGSMIRQILGGLVAVVIHDIHLVAGRVAEWSALVS